MVQDKQATVVELGPRTSMLKRPCHTVGDETREVEFRRCRRRWCCNRPHPFADEEETVLRIATHVHEQHGLTVDDHQVIRLRVGKHEVETCQTRNIAML